MATRGFNQTTSEPRKGFDKIPRWVAKAPDFSNLDELACKLLVYFANVRKWGNDTTPWTTTDELSQRIGASWKRTKRALVILGALGAIRTETKRREKRFKIIYLSPHDHSQEQDTAGQTPLRSRNTDAWGDSTATTPATKLDVPLDASVEGRYPSSVYAKTEDNLDRFVTLICPKRQASLGDDPAWLRENEEPAHASGYTAGEDVDSIVLGRPQ
jgi:hypothetical protein